MNILEVSMKIKCKLSRIMLYRIKKSITNFDFDDITFAPNLQDPLRFYDIRFYRKRHIIQKITFADLDCYNVSSVRNQLRKYFKVDFII